ncbi:DNA-protecting protein DprA [Marinobacterium sp. AK62]|uniref:DNA-protecting protein DprA n=1 Tax=Marinobacterium alkalitolerans TaxID=1542925 RepID=A0ABS3ZE39_9GAMM|nr:DNA-processing protein DprA [Marinobacterium alkalitolerans]MBP0049944.1 DNA-protecting protein DprA [Marinobacterium alkalitolerans]
MNGDPREWIAASLLPGMGPATAARLSQEGVFLPALMRGETGLPTHLRLRRQTLAAIHDYQRGGTLRQQTEQMLEQADNAGWQLLTPTHPDYPVLLNEIADPPLVLWCQGNLSALPLPMLGMVGSRSASRNGCRLAYEFAAALSEVGLMPVSGLALGIDAAVHQGCVDRFRPTLAVVGTGLDRVYPRRNARLARALLDTGGLIISEYPPGTPPRPAHFPRRNRLISGLSVGTLVIEAALRSGSLITARQALEQGREVFALPGAISNPLSRGCHALIREGATLVEQVDHIVEPLSALLGVLASECSSPAAATTPEPPADALLLQVPFEPIWLDTLALQTELDVSALQSRLMLLEMEGWVEIRGASVCRVR